MRSRWVRLILVAATTAMTCTLLLRHPNPATPYLIAVLGGFGLFTVYKLYRSPLPPQDKRPDS